MSKVYRQLYVNVPFLIYQNEACATDLFAKLASGDYYFSAAPEAESILAAVKSRRAEAEAAAAAEEQEEKTGFLIKTYSLVDETDAYDKRIIGEFATSGWKNNYYLQEIRTRGEGGSRILAQSGSTRELLLWAKENYERDGIVLAETIRTLRRNGPLQV